MHCSSLYENRDQMFGKLLLRDLNSNGKKRVFLQKTITAKTFIKGNSETRKQRMLIHVINI